MDQESHTCSAVKSQWDWQSISYLFCCEILPTLTKNLISVLLLSLTEIDKAPHTCSGVKSHWDWPNISYLFTCSAVKSHWDWQACHTCSEVSLRLSHHFIHLFCKKVYEIELPCWDKAIIKNLFCCQVLLRLSLCSANKSCWGWPSILLLFCY